MLPKYVIITAGGAGVRMNSPLPKQFMELLGKPVLMHTLGVFLEYDASIRIVLVLPHKQMEYWQELCRKHTFHHPIVLESGGPTRFHSVKNGLKHVPHEALVGIHDGVRPLVSLSTIANAFNIAGRFGNAIPVVGVNESVRMVEGPFSKTADRSRVKLVQTPQCFLASQIKEAYQVNYHEHFTDDASVLENAGHRVYLTEGNQENIKITTQADLVVAEALISKKRQDLHP